MSKFYKNSINLIKQFGFKSLFFKRLRSITIIVFIPLLIVTYITTFLFFNAQDIKQQNYISTSFAKSVTMFDNILEQLDKMHALYSANTYFNSFLLSPEFNPHQENFNMITQVENLMQYYKSTVPYVTSVSTFSFNNHYVLSTDASNFIENIDANDWYLYYKEHPDLPRFVIDTPATATKPQQITFVYKMYSGVDEIGLVIFSLNKRIITEMLIGNDDFDDTLFFVFDDEETIYSSTTFESSRQYVSYNSAATKEAQTLKEQNHYLLYKKSDVGNYTYVNQYPLPNNNSAIQWIIFFTVILLLSVLLSVLLSLFLSLQSYGSIYKVLSTLYIDDPQLGTDSEKEYNEVEFITERISHYRKEKKNWENELSEKVSALKKTQATSLQMQFTPHFLFNTLNHISVTIMNLTDKKNPASHMIYLLSQLLSAALDTDTYITSIEKEIEYAKIYVEIESLKHNNNFDFECSYSDEILDYKTPKLILQPILENSFSHGINKLHAKWRGKIKLTVTQEHNNIIFTVQDNGVGISKHKLIELQEQLAHNEPPSSRHIGLNNVNQKIRLLFGEEYGVFLDSNNSGTTVKVIIPQNK